MGWREQDTSKKEGSYEGKVLERGWNRQGMESRVDTAEKGPKGGKQ